MKRFLLNAICATAVVSTAFAAPPVFTELKAVSFNNIITPKNANYKNKVATSSQNEIFLTGLFDTEFTAATPLVPIATSSYIIKFNNELVAQINVAIQGAATITDITTNPISGNICVVGTFADEVVFESNDGNNQTAYGMKVEGAYTTNQTSSFIATYSSGGTLTSLTTFVPEFHSELKSSPIYYPNDGDVYFLISDVEYSADGFLFAATYTGRTEVKNAVFESGYINIFDFLHSDLRAGAVFRLDEMLNISKIASFTPGNNITTESNVRSVSVAANDSKIYPGFIVTGDQTLDILGTTEKYSFPISDAGVVTFGNLFISIDKDGKVSKKNYEFQTDKIFDKNLINKMDIIDNKLIVAGTFIDKLAFDNNIKAVGADDIYVVALDPDNLSVKWTYNTGYNENDPTKFEELFNSIVFLNNIIRINGYTDDMATHTGINNLAFDIDLETGKLLQSSTNDGIFTTGACGFGNDYFQATVNGPAITDVNLKKYAVTSGVNDAIIDNDVVAYPNPTTDILNFNSACDVTIISVDGKVVATANDATSIDVTSLTSGIYFASITKDNATKTVKIIKK